jgi:hypothetical protein
MEKRHHRRQVTPAQTMYNLSEAEVIAALDDYVRRQCCAGEKVPTGESSVWVRDRHTHDLDDCYATLAIEHREGE